MEQEIYVNEKPKSCYICPCFDTSEAMSSITGTYTKFKQGRTLEDCPLKSIHDHDKELVAKVLEEVSKELENEIETYCEIRQCNSPHYQGDYLWFNYVKFRKFAEKLQKEFKYD